MGSHSFLGFVLLTHEKPDQILRLIDRLNFMFDNAPIACHHDFAKCNLPLESIPKNVSFVKPHLKTAWGRWSLVEATVKGIDLLYSGEDKPEWFILLSGTDYPVKPAEKIVSDLKNSQFDVHISSKKLVRDELKNGQDEAMYQRYRSMIFQFPSIVHLVQSLRNFEFVTEDIVVKNPIYTRYFIPFSDEFICFMGSQWFSANQKAAKYILEFHKTPSTLKNYYKKVSCPDESYFHTILNNADYILISNKFWRYFDWTGQKSHPRKLTVADLPIILESDAHFARKFDLNENPQVFDKLDEVIGYGQKKIKQL